MFVRREGSGPSMTLLHGFPSSSHDWAKVAPALAERYALTMPDLLGFGASTKPHEHRYSLLEQADLVEALWGREGIESTVVVAHDYSVSVAQELLTRQRQNHRRLRKWRFAAISSCRRRDSNPRHADYDSAALTD